MSESINNDNHGIATTRTTRKISHADEGSSETTNVKVMVRVRPFNSKELAEEGTGEVLSVIFMDESDKRVSVLDPTKNYIEKEAFEFDQTFWSIPESQKQYTTKSSVADQEAVFQHTGKAAVDASLSAYNGTIFAYGQTGSGKTHSMFGSIEDPGITLRLMKYLFEQIQQKEIVSNKATNTGSTQTRSYTATVEISFLEIYNEKVRDLLVDSSAQNHKGGGGYTDCKVRFHPSTGTFVEGLRRVQVTTTEQCMEILRTGMEHRSVASTNMNEASSRSHALLQLCVKQKDALKGTLKVSLVNLVDLAGSERVKMSGAQGTVLTEAKNINLSLSTLRRVIDILIENSSKKSGKTIPPYRESMLTWLLSDSLGGNSRTTMMATISPAKSNIEDTINTLRYATKAKSIVCNVVANEQRSAVVVGALKAEMEELRKQLIENSKSENIESQRQIRDELDKRENEYRVAVEEHHQLEASGTRLRHEIERVEEQLFEQKQALEGKMGVAEDVKRMDQEAQQALEILSQQEIAIKESIAQRATKEDEISQAMLQNESLDQRQIELTEAAALAHEEEKIERQKKFSSIFRNSVTIQREKIDILNMKQNIEISRDKLERVSASYEKTLKLYEEATTGKENLIDFMNHFETKLASKNAEFEQYMNKASEEETLQRNELIQTKDKLHNTIEEIAETLHKIEKVKVAHTTFLLQEEQTLIIKETNEVMEALNQLDEKLLPLQPQVLELRSKNAEAQTVLNSSTAQFEKLEKENISLCSIETRYVSRLNELELQLQTIETSYNDICTNLEQEDTWYHELNDNNYCVNRSHSSLKAFVTRKCLGHSNDNNNNMNSKGERVVGESPYSRGLSGGLQQSNNNINDTHDSPPKGTSESNEIGSPLSADGDNVNNNNMNNLNNLSSQGEQSLGKDVTKFVRYESFDRNITPTTAYRQQKLSKQLKSNQRKNALPVNRSVTPES